ncbi:MAG: dihydrofolate reductase [Candidatus Pacebacteria bacterium]|nr:dihydrofolate reductase [Candidatus Paceibacterota bacterium]
MHSLWIRKFFIIGGSSVYAEGLAYADTLHLTLIHGDKPADTFFPPYEHLFTKETKEGDFVSPDGIAYSFVMLEK